MSEENHHPAPAAGRSWRAISQDVASRALSAQGRRRRRWAWFKFAVAAGVLGGLGWAGYTTFEYWRHDRAALAEVVRSEAVRDVEVSTDRDGVLTKKWVRDVLALPPGATLLSLDLPVLRDRLLAHGQVRSAVLIRSFPDMLHVMLQERTPVARVQVAAAGGSRQLFVARDGVVYEGSNYDPAMVATLPWLDGIRLTRTANGFAPIAGMDAVNSLLTTAQVQAPQLYRNWLIVSLARLAERDEIVVRATNIPEIVFSRREDFFKQLSQLDYVSDAAAQFPEAGLKSVNLALGDRVPVRLERTPDDLAKEQPVSVPAPNLNVQSPHQTRKGKRDL